MTRPFKQKVYRQNQRGAALVELTLVVPLMLLFIAGILELGRLFGQLAWSQRSVYEAAYAGSFLTEQARHSATIDRVNKLIGIHHNDFLPDPSINEQPESANTFSVQLAANRSRLLAVPLGMDLGITSKVSAPILYPQSLPRVNYNTFANPSSTFTYGEN